MVSKAHGVVGTWSCTSYNQLMKVRLLLEPNSGSRVFMPIICWRGQAPAK